jgi:predicted nucleotidyltransferase
MGVDETLLNEVVRRVLTVARPNRIILFGSVVTRQMTKDSDIDLLVVEPDPANSRDRSVKIRRALGDVHYPVDVTVMSTERFEETKSIIGGIAYRLQVRPRSL